MMNFKELLRVLFLGIHTVFHVVLSDYVSFHSIYIKETLHMTDSLYFFIGGNGGIGTWKYTKAILNNIYELYSWTYLKLMLNHCK